MTLVQSQGWCHYNTQAAVGSSPRLQPSPGKSCFVLSYQPSWDSHSPPQQLEEHAAQGKPVGTAVIGHALLQNLRGHVPVGAPVEARRP